MIKTDAGNLYTGITTDLDRRFAEHKNQEKGARYFRFSEPADIVFREKHVDRSSATKREIEIKRMTRTQKEALINYYKPS